MDTLFFFKVLSSFLILLSTRFPRRDVARFHSVNNLNNNLRQELNSILEKVLHKYVDDFIDVNT